MRYAVVRKPRRRRHAFGSLDPRPDRVSTRDVGDGRHRLGSGKAGVWTLVGHGGRGFPVTASLSMRGDSTGQVRRHYDENAHKYNRQVAFYERVLFGGARRWVCSQAEGDVLEIAVGTGRNLRHYPAGVRLTGIALTPAMHEFARREAAEVGLDPDLRTRDAAARA